MRAVLKTIILISSLLALHWTIIMFNKGQNEVDYMSSNSGLRTRKLLSENSSSDQPLSDLDKQSEEPVGTKICNINLPIARCLIIYLISSNSILITC